MIVLALDTSSSRTGWCKGEAGGPVATGSHAFPRYGDEIGRLLAHFERWMTGLCEGVDLIAFEQPVRPFRAANLITLRKLYSLAGMVERVAVQTGITCCEVNNSTMKKLIYGDGGMSSAEKKKRAVGLIRGWGVETGDHDEADAVAVFLTAISFRDPRAFGEWRMRRDDIAMARMGGRG